MGLNSLNRYISCGLCLFAGYFGSAEVAPIAEPATPNIVLITLDTCRADRLGCYGYGMARTPAMDSLAEDGVLCTDATTTAPITLPAHASIMTGLLPPAHGVRDNGAYRLADAHVTLAEVLKARGYETAAFVSAVVLGRRYNLAQGFDVYDDNLWAEDEPPLFMIRDRPAPRTAAKAADWLKARNGNPFFLWVHFFDPHQPYESRYPNRHLLPTPYDAEIAQADQGVEMLIAALKEQGLFDSTFVILTADHGESLGEHGEKTHAVFVYDATIRVPLIFRYPPVFPRGARYTAPVRCIDIMPTTLAHVSAVAAPEMQGVNLTAQIRGDAAPESLPQYAESLISEVGFGMAPLYALRHAGKKWIRAPKPELYDLAADANEVHNTFVEPTTATRSMDAMLQAMLDTSASFNKEGTTPPLDAEMLETLRALGYLAPERQRSDVSGMDPKDGLALYTQLESARHAAQRGDYATSEVLLREIIGKAPNHLTARNVLGLVLSRLGKLEDARHEYRASLAIDPTQARVLHMLGVLSVREGKLDDAERFCRDAVERSPGMLESMVILGFIALQKNDTAEAERWYKRALEADPQLPRAHLAYADLFFTREQYKEALPYYRKVLEAVPNHFAAALQAGLCAQRLREYDEARAMFERARAMRPDSWIPVYNLGCLASVQGKTEIALALLEEAAGIAPDDSGIAAHLKSDPDLARLQTLPEFLRFLERIK